MLRNFKYFKEKYFVENFICRSIATFKFIEKMFQKHDSIF